MPFHWSEFDVERHLGKVNFMWHLENINNLVLCVFEDNIFQVFIIKTFDCKNN